MGKDLHHTIRPFIERTLSGHQMVNSITRIEHPEYFVYIITRNKGFEKMKLVLVDEYYFGDVAYQKVMPLLNGGGFVLVARPEANGLNENDELNKIGIGKLKKLLGALNKPDFWTYKEPEPKKKNGK